MQSVISKVNIPESIQQVGSQELLAGALWVLGILAWLGSLLFVHPVNTYLYGPIQSSIFERSLNNLFSFLTFQGLTSLGVLIILRGSSRRYGWLILSAGFVMNLGLLAESYGAYALLVAPELGMPLGDLAGWVQNLWVLNLALLFIYVPLFFPDGSLPSSGWRPIFILVTIYLSIFTLVLAFADLPLTNIFLDAETTVRNPFGFVDLDLLPPALARGIFIGNGVLFGGSLLIAFSSLIFRWRAADRETRQQIKWLFYMLGVLVALRLVDWVAGALMDAGQFADTFTLYIRYAQRIAASGFVGVLGFAVFKYRLYDIDLIINRTLVYGVLSSAVVGAYVLIVTALGALMPVDGGLLPSILATGIIAAVFGPVRDWLQRVVNRLMFGAREDPYAVLSQLGRKLTQSAEPDEALELVVETVANSLKLPYVAIKLENRGEYRTWAEYGSTNQSENDGKIAFQLVHQNELVGELVIEPRSPGEHLSTRDRSLLEDISHQVAAAAYSVRLWTALQESRQRLVRAREEERRRLRRDLHDGLGPTLASHTFKLDMAMDVLREDPDRAHTQLKGLHRETRQIVSEIRRLIHQLRPPVLDDMGLVGAVQAHIQRSTYQRNRPEIVIDVHDEGLPELPAAVELAAYRITLEAITNVIRHAQAERCTVRYRIAGSQQDTRLKIEVCDDGMGFPDRLQYGVGLTSMRERAEELGGRFSARGIESGGTSIFAELPFTRG
jgi:signal transduction histidine kinase